MILILAFLLLSTDVASIKSEADPERRSELALALADREISAAKQAYTNGDDKAEQQALTDLRELVDISYDALEHSNKAPRKSKYYKNAELKVSMLIRRLSGFRDEINFEGRAPVEVVIQRMSEIHDELLAAIMSKKK